MKTHVVKMEDGKKRKFFLVPVKRDETMYIAPCDGCFFYRDECAYPIGNVAPKCMGSSHADCQDRIYREKV